MGDGFDKFLLALSCGGVVLFVVKQSHKVRASQFYLHTASEDDISGQSISEDVVCAEVDHLPNNQEFMDK